MRKKSGIKSLEDILNKISNKPKLKKKLEKVDVTDALDEVLGYNLRKYITNKYFNNGTLFIHLSSSVLRSELSYQKEGMIDSINTKIGKKLVKEIVLK
tara:strand:- start:102 stop:395 length:294 start_codon:yes stop_codon:yes gene_type:complete